jgi:hypothetical protein
MRHIWMNGWEAMTIAAVIVAVGFSAANGETISLQQGVNGYSGCQDSFVGNGGRKDDRNVNFGINEFLVLNSDQYWTN